MNSNEPLGPPEVPEKPQAPERTLKPFIGIVIVTLIVSLLYRLLVYGNLEQSSLMFIGLPAVLAILLAFIPPSKTATGMIMKGISLFLLLLGILFIEGFICILMAAPLVYAVGFVIGILIDRSRVKRAMNRFRIVVFPALILLSLEGINETLSFPRQEVVTIETVIALPPALARARLSRGPTFDLTERPIFLKLGFPAPHSIEGEGTAVGDQWQIHFAGGEGEPGTCVFEVSESGSDHLQMRRIRDTSHISHWLDWQRAEWRLSPSDQGTRVTLTLHYRRLLDPAWYFKPIERYGVRKAAGYFIDQTFGE